MAGSVVGLLALPYAFIGAMLEVGAPGLSAEQLQIASAATVVAALIGYLGVGDDGAVFIGVGTAGLFGVLGSYLTGSHGMSAPHSATVLLCIALLLLPMYNSLAIWLGRLPLPVLPRSPSDLIRDVPQPPRPQVYGAVARADGLLTGMLMGSAAVAVVAYVVLIRREDHAVEWFVAVTTLCYWLRTRPYVIVRQRAPLVLAALTGTLALLLGPAMAHPHNQLSTAGPVVIASGALAIMAGLAYSRRMPGPYLRRYAELVEILLTLAVLPLAAWVLGLYAKLSGRG
jgi:type VII secretion integral membrane protein EccD